jgi:hypothetical protein
VTVIEPCVRVHGNLFSRLLSLGGFFASNLR